MSDKKMFGTSKDQSQPKPSKSELQPEQPKVSIQRPAPLGNYLTHSLNDVGITPESESQNND